MPARDPAANAGPTAKKWSLLHFFLGGALAGALAGALLAWLDYGRPDVGFMDNHVLGLAALAGAAAMMVAAARNWFKRNPLT